MKIYSKIRQYTMGAIMYILEKYKADNVNKTNGENAKNVQNTPKRSAHCRNYNLIIFPKII